MRSLLGKRVSLHRCRPGFSSSDHSIHSQQISRKNLHRVDMIELVSLLQPLELLQLEVCFLHPSSASCTGLSCDPTCHSTRTRQQNRKESSVHTFVFRFTVVFLAFAFRLAFPLFALLTLSFRAFHLPDDESHVLPTIVVGSLRRRDLFGEHASDCSVRNSTRKSCVSFVQNGLTPLICKCLGSNRLSACKDAPGAWLLAEGSGSPGGIMKKKTSDRLS